MPSGWLLPCQRVFDLDACVAGRQRIQLITVDHVLDRARRVEEPSGHRAPDGHTMAEHRHQRDDARAAGDEQEGPAVGLLPDEVAAYGPAQLEAVAYLGDVDEIGRHLAVGEPLDRYRGRLAWRRGKRIATRCLVTVLSGQAHIDVLPGPVSRPVRHVEGERPRPRCLLEDGRHGRLEPAQSPQYRCSSHGSPRRW